MSTQGSEASAATLAQLRQEVEQLRTERQQLLERQRENDLLRTQCQQLLEQYQASTRTIEQLQHQLQCLLRRFYGRSAEKIDPKQMLLFKELLEQLAPPPPTRPATPEPDTSSQPARKGHGRRRLPADLPRETIVHDLPEDQKPCPCCGKMRDVIGREVEEKFDYVPPKVSVLEIIQLKYACRHCEETAAESGPQIVLAEKPHSAIDKCLAAPGLLAYVIVSKYGDPLPLYRLERILDRYGIKLSRQTMCGWMAQCAEALRPLHERMVYYAKQSKVIHTDDTPVEVLDRELDHTRTGRFWVYLGDADHPYDVFTYTPSRSRDGPMGFLKDWSGYLQADAFGGYDGIYAGHAGGRVVEVACWAHARRKFYDARTSDAAGSTQALAYIRLLYDVEDEAKRRFKQQREDNQQFEHRGEADRQFDPQSEGAERRSLSAIRYALRQESAVPLLEKFKAWLDVIGRAKPAMCGQVKTGHLEENVIRGMGFFGPWWTEEARYGESSQDGGRSRNTSAASAGLVVSANWPRAGHSPRHGEALLPVGSDGYGAGSGEPGHRR